MKDKNKLAQFLFILSPFIAFSIAFFSNLSNDVKLSYMLAITVLMAIWWITEIVPIGVTSLLPVVLFPLFGIMDGKEVSSVYFNDIIFLFIGGFLMAIAIQKWNLHQRIALFILKKIGISPARILFGFMLATTFLSMWISNTATTMMMVPILMSIISKLEEINGSDKIKLYTTGVLLAVGYSATVGGIATLVGTPPNLSFVRIYEMYFPNAPEISFGDWFIFAAPLTLILFIAFFAYLYFFYVHKKTNWVSIKQHEIEQAYLKLGKAKREEKLTGVIFILMALLWFFRADIAFGDFTIPGWSYIFPQAEFISDGTIAIFIGVILFLIPTKNTKKDSHLLTWRDTIQLPWEIILLFGGGFAIASGMKVSGLSTWCGQQLDFLGNMHPLLVLILIVGLITFLGEISSNTAMVETFLPVLAGLAISTGNNPLYFMIPATLGASMGFMLPIATPPNAIIYSTKKIQMKQMMRTGFLLNIISITIIALYAYFLGGWFIT